MTPQFSKRICLLTKHSRVVFESFPSTKGALRTLRGSVQIHQNPTPGGVREGVPGAGRGGVRVRRHLGGSAIFAAEGRTPAPTEHRSTHRPAGTPGGWHDLTGSGATAGSLLGRSCWP